MRRALRLAERGRGRVEPNPMVGCVIVRGGRIIGQGFHRRFGGPHAEIEALRECGQAARGATVYVTLEPCCYFGKTPPCTDALIAAGVRRVVAAMIDPNPRVAGRGLRALRAAGIETRVGLLESEARALNAPFCRLIQQRRPWVILKWAQSLDGVIATYRGDSRWISDRRMRAHAHATRSRVDAILVGAGTVLRDDPLLTCRLTRPRRTATRIVLDSHLRCSERSCALVRTARRVPTIFFCGPAAHASRVARLEAAGCTVIRAPLERSATHDARLRLTGVLKVLAQHGVTNLLVEGGGRVLGSFVDQRLADEVHVYIAATLIGGAGAVHALGGRGAPRIAAALPLDGRIKGLGGGWLFEGRAIDRRT